MKARVLLLLFLLCASPVSAATTYFGFGTDSSGTATGTPNADGGYGNGFAFSFWMDESASGFADSVFVTAFTCPGSGNQDVVDISAYVTATSGSPTIQMAIYSEDGSTLMSRGTSAVTMSGGPSWQGHQSAGVITQSVPLVGGVRYIVFQTHSATGVYSIHGNSAELGSTKSSLNQTSYIGAIPTSTPATNGSIFAAMVRVGVQAQAGGGGSTVRHRVNNQ